MKREDVDAARARAGLKPLVNAKTGEEKKERGHGRSAREVLHVVGGSPELRGVPLIGTGPGGLENSRPGGELGRVDALAAEALELNEHAREIARQKMMEARERLRRPDQKGRS